MALFFLAFMTACSEKDAGTSTESGSASEERKILTIAQGADIQTFDAQNHNDGVTGSVLVNFGHSLFEKRDGDMKIEPALAKEYEIIDDVTWEIKLRDDVIWHNGDKFTAEDVKFTIERVIKDEALKEHHVFKVIKEVQVIDEFTFRLITEQPYPTMLALLSKNGSQMQPKKYIEEQGWDYYLSNPINNGPYKFKEWQKDNVVILERFDDYFGGTPYWDEIRFRAIPENSTRVSELLAGNVDIITNVPTNEWDRIDDNEGTNLHLGDGTRVYNLIMKYDEGPTSNQKIREAIELAIDKELIINQVLRGAGTPTRTRIAPGVFGFAEDLYGVGLYDPEKAKELVKEAGYPDGVELELLVPKGRYLMDAEMGTILADMLGKVGINVKLNVLEFSAYINKFYAGDYGGLTLIAYGDDFLDASYGMNEYRTENATPRFNYSSEKYDQLYLEALSNMDSESREKQLIEMQHMIFRDEHVQRPFIHLKVPYGLNDRIEFNSRITEDFHAEKIRLK